MSPTNEQVILEFTKMSVDQITAINIENRGWQTIKPGSFEINGVKRLHLWPGGPVKGVRSADYQLGYYVLAAGGYREDGSYNDDEYDEEMGLITEISAVR